MFSYFVLHMATELGFVRTEALWTCEKREAFTTSSSWWSGSEPLKVQHLPLHHENPLLCRELDLRIRDPKRTVTVKSSPFVFWGKLRGRKQHLSVAPGNSAYWPQLGFCFSHGHTRTEIEVNFSSFYFSSANEYINSTFFYSVFSIALCNPLTLNPPSLL